MEESEWIDLSGCAELDLFEDSLKDRFVTNYVKLAHIKGKGSDSRKEAYEQFLMIRTKNTPYDVKGIVEGLIKTMQREIYDLNNQLSPTRQNSSSRSPSSAIGLFVILTSVLMCVRPTASNLIDIIQDRDAHRLGHTCLSSIELLPMYSIKYSTDDGFLLLRPSLFSDRAFTIMTHGNVALKCLTLEGSSKTYSTGFKYHSIPLNSDCDEDDSLIIVYRLHGSDSHSEMTIDIHDLLDLSCEGKHLNHQTSYILPYPPGLSIQIYANGTYAIDWDIHNQSADEFCDVFYWTKITKPCSMATSKKLLALSCEVEVKEDEDQELNNLLVSLHGSGEMRLLSDKNIITEICHEQCTLSLGKVDFIHVTCPDGREYKFCTQQSIMGKMHSN